MKRAFAFAAVAVCFVVAIVIYSEPSSEEAAINSPNRGSVEISPHPDEVAAAQAMLAWKLLTPHSNKPQTVVSPASLASAVSIVALGASPTMKAALMKALNFDKLAAEEAEKRLGEARATLMNANPETFITADRFVHPPEMPLPPRINAEFDKRRVSQVGLDLRTIAGVGAVNDWVKKATRGEIDGILSEPFALPTAVALNALYFKAKWEKAFDAKQTKDEDFHEADGGRGRVKMMHQYGEYAVRQSPEFVGVELPFAGERYAMTIVTTTDRPAPLARFADISGWLSGKGFWKRPIKLSMPRFRLDTSGSLLPALLGDLAAAMASPSPFEGFDGQFKLGDILQRTKIEVDEEGAKAAAVTGVFLMPTSAPPPPITVTIDKPYLFALRDRDSGLILAAGYVGKTPAD